MHDKVRFHNGQATMTEPCKQGREYRYDPPPYLFKRALLFSNLAPHNVTYITFFVSYINPARFVKHFDFAVLARHKNLPTSASLPTTADASVSIAAESDGAYSKLQPTPAAMPA